MRAFLAVAADPAWVEHARALSSRLRAACPPASWARPEAWHLTLRFLGGIEDGPAAAFAAAMEPHILRATGGELPAEGPIVFPRRGPARVLGVTFADSPARASLEALARAAESEARRIGAPPEDRPFCPHVTLARIRQSWPASAVATFRRETAETALPPWRVERIVLYRSRLEPGGAVHTPVGEWSLAGREAGAPA